MPLFTDQTGNIIELDKEPQRIISLVPSQTELLYHLGLDEKVIGITKFCVHPENWFGNKTKVGGTKNIKMDVVRHLKPDLIIANKEENTKESVEEMLTHYRVWISDVVDLQTALHMIDSIGEMTGSADIAVQLINNVDKQFENLRNILSTTCNELRAAYLIWRDPYMAAGGDTFINAMMRECYLKNIFEDTPRYPVVEIANLAALNCEVLLLSSEPYPFKLKHVEELRQQLPKTKIILVDGEMFSWYGSRLLHAPAYFEKLRGEV